MFRNAFKGFFRVAGSGRVGAKKMMSTAVDEAPTGLLTAMGVTFGTYMMADFLSNFLQHPTQLVRLHRAMSHV